MVLALQYTHTQKIDDLKTFCRLYRREHPETDLWYGGRHFHLHTNIVHPGEIVWYKGNYYFSEEYGDSGIGSFVRDENGMREMRVCLYSAYHYGNYMEQYRSTKHCSIEIQIWDRCQDAEAPIMSYAFFKYQLKKAQALVRKHKDVDIYLHGEKVTREQFLSL